MNEVDNSHRFGPIVARMARHHRSKMGPNVLPFTVRRTAPLPARTPAVRLIAVTRTATLAITISPLRRSA